MKRVIAEMGGKNCAIVDADADLDDAVPAILASAFAYAGQKCSAISRVLAHEAIHDSLAARLAGAVELLRVGQAEDLETEVPPVIEEDAQDRVAGYQELTEDDGRILARAEAPDRGGLVLHADPRSGHRPSSSVLRDEVFGPLLTVEPVASIDAACDVVDGLPFALTGALFSRNPATVDAVVDRSPVGNLYVNRRATGAMVGRHRSAATGSQALARRRGAPTTCSSSPTHGSSPRTRPAMGWWSSSGCAEGQTARSALQHRQEALDLPGGDLDAVLLPLLALDLDEAVEGVLAEDPQTSSDSAATSIASPSEPGSCSMPRWPRSSGVRW